MKEYKFTLEDVLSLINHDSSDRIILAEYDREETWLIAPMSSSLIRTKENLDRKVASIGIWDDMLQIWLVPKEKLSERDYSYEEGESL